MKLTKLRYIFPPMLSVLIAIGIYILWPAAPKISQAPNISLSVSTEVVATTQPTKNTKDNKNQSVNLSEVYSRPLFSNTRRNPVPKEEVIVEDTPIEETEIAVEIVQEQIIAQPKLQFLGVIKRGGMYSALLVHRDAEKWFNVGDTISKWEIIGIKSELITLKYKEQEMSIAITR